MSRFIYVFTAEAAEDMQQRGYELLKADAAKKMWIFLNKDPEDLEFSSNYQCVLSNTLSF